MSELLKRWRQNPTGWSPPLIEGPLAVALPYLEPGTRPGMRLLDLGCGRGHLAALFRTGGATVLGLDPDLKNLRIARARGSGALLVVAEAEHLPLAEGSIDGLFALSVLQYTDRPKAFKECRRVLKAGGRFAIIENLAGNPFAKLYRGLKHLAGSAYPRHQTPRRHLSWSDLSSWSRELPLEKLETFHLIAPVLALLPSRRNGPAARWVRWLAVALRGLDNTLLRWLPWTRRLAWIAVLVGQRSRVEKEESHERAAN